MAAIMADSDEPGDTLWTLVTLALPLIVLQVPSVAV